MSRARGILKVMSANMQTYGGAPAQWLWSPQLHACTALLCKYNWMHGIHADNSVLLWFCRLLPVALQVGLVQADMTPEARRAAYLSEITYVTNSELGFDYLRDNLAGVSIGGGIYVEESRLIGLLS
jgi:hypothetical protein